ncbi:hypothetical protein LSM04_007717 [Trypanosoma melophagium]|uniref:uncharacterized protein n=1 Tax=Trypanosoma melophagium TaxID=715481 RepID=UPI00351A302A|nr:hypothetical protein LSM04_007717 [Trypanosoma melophagium]
MSRAADDTTLRPENLGDVRPKQLEEGKVTVRALAKAFESLETEKPVIEGKSNRDESLHFDPISLHIRAFEGKNTDETITSETDEMLLELLAEDEIPKNQEQEGEQELEYDKDILGADKGLDFDLEEDGDEDIILDDEESDLELDSDLDLDTDDIEAEREAKPEEKQNQKRRHQKMKWEKKNKEEDSEPENLSENEINEKDEDFLIDDSLEIDGNMESDVYKEGSMKQEVNDSKDTVNAPVIASEVATDFTVDSALIITPTNITEEIITESKALGSNIISSTVVDSSTATEPTNTFSATVVSQHGGFLPPYPSIMTLVAPSHALPNNRYLHELFMVIKVNDAAFIGNKKDRIWNVDFFRRRFANLDLVGYMSFESPAANLYHVEKDPIHSRRLKLYFFEAPHPYELEFTSTERRHCFYEVSTTLVVTLLCVALCVLNVRMTLF